MRCFGNNKPKKSSSDRMSDLKAKSIYKTNVNDFQRGNMRRNRRCKNYNGHIGFYKNGFLRNTKSYNYKNLLQKGYALCVDGAYSKNCQGQVNLEKNNQIGEGLQRGLFSCPKNTIIGAKSVKLSMGSDSIYNVFEGASLNSAEGCNPLGGVRFMESWPMSFIAKQGISPPPWNNVFGFSPIESWNNGDGPTPQIPKPDNGTLTIGGSVTNYDISMPVTDPDNNLFGADYCQQRAQSGYGPLKYKLFSQVQSFTVARGKLYDPTGTGYTGPGYTGPGSESADDNDNARVMPCNFIDTKDIYGNSIRIPKQGDLAISGVNAILDINSNLSQVENISKSFLYNAFIHFVNPPLPLTSVPILQLIIKDARLIAPKLVPTNDGIDAILNEVVEVFRKSFIAMSWAFQYLTGVGVVDRVCCIDNKNHIWKIIIKDLWGNMLPPEYLPGTENVIFGKDPTLAAVQRSWRGDKSAVKGTRAFIGGVHTTPSENDISYMIQGMSGSGAVFPEIKGTVSGALPYNDINIITGLSIRPQEGDAIPLSFGAPPIGQRNYGTVSPPPPSYETVGGIFPNDIKGATAASSKALDANTYQQDIQWITADGKPVVLGDPAIYRYLRPKDWINLEPSHKIMRWGIWKNLFAGLTPGNKTEGTSPGGGGIAFISQDEIGAFFKKLLGVSVAPIAIMGYQNRSNWIWGSEENIKNIDNSTSTGATGINTLVSHAMLITKDGYTAENYNEDDYGISVLKKLHTQPYSVQKIAGSCGRKNLAYGNNTKQNYLVSYENNGGNVNFAVNQKLYTNFKN